MCPIHFPMLIHISIALSPLTLSILSSIFPFAISICPYFRHFISGKIGTCIEHVMFVESVRLFGSVELHFCCWAWQDEKWYKMYVSVLIHNALQSTRIYSNNKTPRIIRSILLFSIISNRFDWVANGNIKSLIILSYFIIFIHWSKEKISIFRVFCSSRRFRYGVCYLAEPLETSVYNSGKITAAIKCAGICWSWFIRFTRCHRFLLLFDPECFFSPCVFLSDSVSSPLASAHFHFYHSFESLFPFLSPSCTQNHHKIRFVCTCIRQPFLKLKLLYACMP